MLRNYFKIAWRNIVRSKIYTAINVLSLALGITACIVIYLIVHYEFSFDTFHPDKERIYRVVSNFQEANGNKHSLTTVSAAVPAALVEEISGIENLVALYPFDATITIPDRANDSKKFDSRILHDYLATVFVDSSCFDIFKYEWLAGNSSTALNDPFKVVITESKAHLYFGSLAPQMVLGKELVYNDSLRVSVSGVIRDWKENTDIHFTDFISFATIKGSFLKNEVKLESWSGNQFSPAVFVKLEKETPLVNVSSQLEDFSKRHESLLTMWDNKLSLHLHKTGGKRNVCCASIARVNSHYFFQT